MSKKKIYILNGPNLAMLGSRQPEIYGTITLEQIKQELTEFSNNVIELLFYQTNDEAEMLDYIYQARQDACGVIINPAAFTHYSYSLSDALILLRERGIAVIEVHLSNPYARESFRHKNVISRVVNAQVSGLGVDSYRLALDHIVRKIAR
ncbi:MAG: 3-dehydroquinate dehydratase [Tropheryma whipplei]|nr:3-dehydroquinate dehydratase [Tropheryma whipplei]